jgi:hypothetical protein
MLLVAVNLPIKIDAQADPVPALLLAALVCLALWAMVSAMNRRDSRPPRPRPPQ